MKFHGCGFLSIAIAAVGLPGLSQLHAIPLDTSCEGLWSGNLHYYQVVTVDDGVMWGGLGGAMDIANGMVVDGNSGYLATITSQAENDYISGLLGGSGAGGSWIGGIQDPEVGVGSEPGGGWAWTTGETWAYSNWANGEPDDSSMPGVAMILNGQWYDVTGGELLKTFVVEWDVAPSSLVCGPSHGVPDTGGTGSLMAASLLFLGLAARRFRGNRS